MSKCELCQWEDTDRCDTCTYRNGDKPETILEEILDREEQRIRGDAIDQGHINSVL